MPPNPSSRILRISLRRDNFVVTVELNGLPLVAQFGLEPQSPQLPGARLHRKQVDDRYSGRLAGPLSPPGQGRLSANARPATGKGLRV